MNPSSHVKSKMLHLSTSRSKLLTRHALRMLLLLVNYIVHLKWIEYGVYGDLSIIYPKPHFIYLRGTISLFLPPDLKFWEASGKRSEP